MKTLFAEQDMKRSKAVTLLVITAVLWSLGGLLIKLVPWHPIAIAGVRSGIATLMFLAVTGKPRWSGTTVQIGGAAAYAATVTFFVAATKMTTAANAILLQYTAPVYVALLGAWFLKEKTSAADWATVAAVLTGMVLFFLDDLTPGNTVGNMLAVLSGISFAILVLCLRRQKNESPLGSVVYGNILTLLVGLPLIFRQPHLHLAAWMSLIGLGVFQLGLSYILYTVSIKHVTALDAVLIPVIEPILNPIIVLLILSEVPGPWAIAGGILVLASVTIRCLLPTIHRSKPIVETEIR